MASLEEKCTDAAQDRYPTAEAAANQQPASAIARAQDGRWTEQRRWWAIGGACALAVLVLFGLFHSRPLPKKMMTENAAAGNYPGLRDVNPTATGSQRAAPSASVERFQPGMGITSATAAKASNALAEPSGAGSPQRPMIARTVSLILQVKDAGASRAALDALLARYQGYAAELTIATPENAARTLSASLRIPAPALEAALADFRKLGRVQNETQAGEEVTQQHADLVARLKNARATEQRLIAILQQRTGKVEEVLQVEEEISSTRGEIERMEAEQKALEHRVDFASVQLQLGEEFKAQLNTPAASAGTRIHNALVNGLGNAGDSILGILLFVEEYGPALMVWVLVLGTPAWLVWRRMRKSERA